MNQLINILLIDDKPDVYLTLAIDAAKNHGINLLYEQYGENSINTLKKYPSISGIIVDGMGFITDGAQNGSETQYHASTVIDLIKTYAKEIDRSPFAICIYTGFFGVYENQFDPTKIPVFNKKSQNQEEEDARMFTFLKEAICSAPEMKLRDKYHPVFEALRSKFFVENKHLKLFYRKSLIHTEELEQMYLKLLAYLEKPVYDKYYFNCCRDILELLFISLKEVALPSQLFDYRPPHAPNQANCLEFILEGKVDIKTGDKITTIQPHGSQIKYFEDPISQAFYFLKHMTNSFSHPKNAKYKYLLIAVINTHIDVLLWISEKNNAPQKSSIQITKRQSFLSDSISPNT
jgi:hypothetical protein